MDEEKTSDEGNKNIGQELRRWTTKQAKLFGGFVVALTILIYPVGLVTLWVQLLNSNDLSPNSALYAAVLVPKAAVAAKVLSVLFASLISNVVSLTFVLQIWSYRSMYREVYGLEGNPFGLQEPGNPPADGKVTVGHYLFTVNRFADIGLAFSVPVVFVAELGGSLSWFLYGTFILASLGCSYYCSLWLKDPATQSSYQQLFSMLALIYILAIVAAICLAGSLKPGLPTVELDAKGKTQTYTLLGHSDGYWNVINQGEILSLSDNKVERARISR